MPLPLILLPLLAQVGPMVSPGAAPPINLPTGAERPAKPRQRTARAAPARLAEPGPLQTCLTDTEPQHALDLGDAWLASAKGPAQTQAQLCRGSALTRLERWSDAQAAFLAGRDAAAGTDHTARATLGAMAGNAALAANAPAPALAALDVAHRDAVAANDAALAGAIALDRARALVALKREPEAATALAEARTGVPDNPEAWLLSATLARRQNKLAEAQQYIEKAAQLMPVDPEIGLEAGVIAELAGHEAAARKSWQSVVAAAPESEQAKTARGYLAQIGAAPAAPKAR
ncbi:MAG: hypothetical protein JF593_02340 [Novosphingobium sp.]|nr:hypothetical protein [Novosphingobium sp.]